MSLLAGLGAAVNIASGLAGMFKKKPKAVTPRKNLLSQAQGVREAAERYGFNPLTLLQYGQTGASTGPAGGAAPLASAQILTEGLRGLDDVLSGDAARRRAADQLEIDLARLKLDQARSGVIFAPAPSASAAIGGSAALGQRPSVHAQIAGAVPVRRSGISNPRSRSAAGSAPVSVPDGDPVPNGKPVPPGESPYAPGFKIKKDEIVRSPGVFEIQNRATGGLPVTIPGEGEPWGVDELATAVVVGAPQVADNFLSRKYREIFGGSDDGPKSSRDYWRDPKGWAEKAAKIVKKKRVEREKQMMEAAAKVPAGSFSKPLPYK